VPKVKRKKKKPSSECARCRSLHRTYLDSSVGEDYKLGLIGTLLIGQRGDLDVEVSTLAEIGYAIDSYLQYKKVRESVFFGRSLKRCTLEESELKAELLRVRAYRNGA
jgi:hypothetical protein